MVKQLKWRSDTQQKNMAWFLPRPNKSHYRGGMPLYCENWLLELAKEILGNPLAKILNLFCGMNKEGFRIDLNPEVRPDILGDAHKLEELVDTKFDIILADPPYSTEEAKQLYGTPKLNYKVWTGGCEKVLNPGGLLIVYHKFVMPNPNPELFYVEKRVFIGNRPYHLPRVAIYFRKRKNGKI